MTWKSGRLVISRSSAVSSSQYGNPCPAQAYARCVCITSFDRPVVPDVGISTATSSGSTAGCSDVLRVARRPVADEVLHEGDRGRVGTQRLRGGLPCGIGERRVA